MPAKKQTVKQKKLLAGRRAGITFQRLAEELGYPSAEAAEAEWERVITPAGRGKHATALAVDRLDRMLAKVWARIEADGDPEAIDQALKILAQRERLAPTPKDNDGAMTKAYDLSVETSRVVEATSLDAALVAAGRKIAERIDEATASGEGMEVTKALYLVPHMMNALREMLATPAARLNAEVTAGRERSGDGGGSSSKLGQLRSIAGGKAQGS